MSHTDAQKQPSTPDCPRGWDSGSATEPMASGWQASLTGPGPLSYTVQRSEGQCQAGIPSSRLSWKVVCACAWALTEYSHAALALGHLSWSVNRGGPCRTGVSVIGRLLLPCVQWSRVLSLVLMPGFLLQSHPPPGKHTHTCPRHGTVEDTHRPFLFRPQEQRQAGSGETSEGHTEGGLSRSVPGESRPGPGSSWARVAWRAALKAVREGVWACGQLQV